MRSVIVLGGALPGQALLESCLRDSDLTIAADRGMTAFLSTGMRPDLLVGDMDSVDTQVLEHFADVPVHRLNPVKDDTDGVDALDIAIEKGAQEITILGALGGRMDHALANLMLLVRAHRKGVHAQILDESVRISRVDGSAWLRGAKGDTVSLLPLGDAQGVTLEGFFYPLGGAALTCEHPLGISNVVVSDEAQVTCEGGDLLLFHYYAAV